MTTPSPEAIEAAARTLLDLTPAENLAYAAVPRWADLHEQDRIYYRRLATAALSSAYPLIVSAKTVEGVWTMTDAEFKRSLAQAKAEALQEAADAVDDDQYDALDPYVAEWLRNRAATIEGKAS